MEALGAFSDGAWDSFAAIFSGEELHSAPHILDQSSFLTDLQAINGGSWFCSLDAFDPNLHYFKQDMSCSSCSTDSSSLENFCHSGDHFHNNGAFSGDGMDFGSFLNDVLMDVNENSTVSAMAGDELSLKRKLEVSQPETMADADDRKKKTRVSGVAQKNKRTQKPSLKADEEGNAATSDGRSSVSDCSEDDNGSQETNGVPVAGVSRKTRASRGSATDPQSLYARKRRERINERLRILQKLVPNGTKVDISTMLEEAVHYVKFLQLQIKLLSSDDTWMYAPLAYNGMDIGLHQKLSPFASY